MRKKQKLAIFLLVVSMGLIFSGAATAQEVDVNVTDDNDNLVTEATTGDEVNVNVAAENTGDEEIDDPYVIISADPETNLEYKSDQATMEFDGNSYTNDPNDPFFYYVDGYGWIWWIGWATPGNDLDPDESATFSVPAIVKAAGTILVTADFYNEEEVGADTLLDSDSFAFQASDPATETELAAGEPTSVNAETVGMQETGTPLTGILMGILLIAGGTILPRIKP